jgi:hypothetical protein
VRGDGVRGEGSELVRSNKQWEGFVPQHPHLSMFKTQRNVGGNCDCALQEVERGVSCVGRCSGLGLEA